MASNPEIVRQARDVSTSVANAGKDAGAPPAGMQALRPQGVPREILIADIHVTGHNIRTEFDTPADDEFVQSIRENGVLERLLVRDNSKWVSAPGVKLRDAAKRADYDLMAGERRLRAAIKAGLTSVPCEVFDVDDEKAYEIMLIENLQSKDLHELDYAKGLQIMMKRYGYNVEQAAARIQKGETFVREMLSFQDLPASAEAAFRSGAISKSHAVLISTIPDEKKRDEYAKRVLQGKGHQDYRASGEPLSVRRAKELKEHEYMKDLGKAPFPLDKQLDATWPYSCLTCPAYNGNTPEMRQGKRPNICLNPTHYEQLVVLNAQRLLREAEQEGVGVLSWGQTNQVFAPRNSGGVVVRSDSKYIDFGGTFMDSGDGYKSKPWAPVIKKAGIEPVIAVAPNGRPYKLVPKDLAEKAAREQGYNKNSSSSSRRVTSAADKKREAEQRRKNAIKRATAKALFAQIPGAAAKGFVFGEKPKLIKQLQAVVNMTISDADSNLCKWLCQQLKLEPAKSQYSYDYRRPLILYVDQQLLATKGGAVGNAKAGFLWGVLMRVLVLERMSYLFDDWRTKPAKENDQILARLGLSLTEIERQVAAELRKPAKAKAKRASKLHLAAKPKRLAKAA